MRITGLLSVVVQFYLDLGDFFLLFLLEYSVEYLFENLFNQVLADLHENILFVLDGCFICRIPSF